MTAPTTSDLEVGATPGPWTYGPVTRTDIVRYQGASGDLNPLHHDDQFAQAGGFPMAISVGMFQAGALATYLTRWLGPENVRRLRLEFRAVVLPGDTLTFEATVTGRREHAGEDVVDLAVSCTTQRDERALVGEATFAVA